MSVCVYVCEREGNIAKLILPLFYPPTMAAAGPSLSPASRFLLLLHVIAIYVSLAFHPHHYVIITIAMSYLCF